MFLPLLSFSFFLPFFFLSFLSFLLSPSSLPYSFPPSLPFFLPSFHPTRLPSSLPSFFPSSSLPLSLLSFFLSSFFLPLSVLPIFRGTSSSVLGSKALDWFLPFRTRPANPSAEVYGLKLVACWSFWENVYNIPFSSKEWQKLLRRRWDFICRERL